jgi:hypothetical protein
MLEVLTGTILKKGVGAVSLFLSSGSFGAGGQDQRTLRIIIPENLNYDGLFDDLFKQYAVSVELEKVKTP